LTIRWPAFNSLVRHASVSLSSTISRRKYIASGSTSRSHFSGVSSLAFPLNCKFKREVQRASENRPSRRVRCSCVRCSNRAFSRNKGECGITLRDISRWKIPLSSPSHPTRKNTGQTGRKEEKGEGNIFRICRCDRVPSRCADVTGVIFRARSKTRRSIHRASSGGSCTLLIALVLLSVRHEKNALTRIRACDDMLISISYAEIKHLFGKESTVSQPSSR